MASVQQGGAFVHSFLRQSSQRVGRTHKKRSVIWNVEQGLMAALFVQATHVLTPQRECTLGDRFIIDGRAVEPLAACRRTQTSQERGSQRKLGSLRAQKYPSEQKTLTRVFATSGLPRAGDPLGAYFARLNLLADRVSVISATFSHSCSHSCENLIHSHESADDGLLIRRRSAADRYIAGSL